MDEKKLKKIIDEQTEDMEIPESLQPEAVEEMLRERTEEIQKKSRKSRYKKGLAAAACCLLVTGAVAGGALWLKGNSSSDQAAIGDTAGDVPSKTGKDTALFEVTGIKTAESYEAVYDYLQTAKEVQQAKYGRMDNGRDMAAGATEELAVAAEADSATGNLGYYDTNVREEGVGEADVVKTDGKRIYTKVGQTIKIAGIEQDDIEALGEVLIEQDTYGAEFFVSGDRLIITYTMTEVVDQVTEEGEIYGGYYREYAVAETFDVSNPAEPKSLGKVTQSGGYNTLRVVGDYVYLFSDLYADAYNLKRDDISTYIPSVQGKSLNCEDILMPQISDGNAYTIVTSFSLDNPGEKVDSKAIFGSGGMCYVSGNNIYICEADYGTADLGNTSTCIRKVSYNDGVLEAVGQTRIEGTLNDSFSIDEYEGNLRLVTTVRYSYGGEIMLLDDAAVSPDSAASEDERQNTNTLYILDENLNELSRIEDLAPDESVYSARFMGNTGYFVTYRQMDPLFSVDLSDPANPQIIGSLKIPGFSEYLHPYGDGLLLGIGMDTDDTGTTTNGVKLSMFDISDPSDVQEVQKYVLENMYATDVAYNYKAALVDVGKNLIGFAAYGDEQVYYVFSYDENGFSLLFERNLAGLYNNPRMLYSGDKIYLVAGNVIESYRFGTFEKVDDIVL